MDNPVRWSVRWLLITGGLGLAYVVVVMTLAVFGGPHMDPTVVAVIISTLAVCVLLAGNATVAGAARDRATVHFNNRMDALATREETEAMFDELHRKLDLVLATMERAMAAVDVATDLLATVPGGRPGIDEPGYARGFAAGRGVPPLDPLDEELRRITGTDES